MTVTDPLPVRVIGIGASAGGLEPMVKILKVLPAGLPHAVLVVLHVSARAHSVLAEILDRQCSVHVVTAAQAEPIRAGHVYVAPPDRHLTVVGPLLTLTTGPPENGVRPAVDPLLRSLAAEHGPASVAVVLSGALGDGAGGARAVADAGGRVFVQDPREAIVSSMPERAIEAAGGRAEIRTAPEIGEELVRLGPPPEIASRRLAGARS